jgi:hypothetical protein
MSKQTEELIAIAIVAFVAWHWLTTSAATSQAQLAVSSANANAGWGPGDTLSVVGDGFSFLGGL